MYTFNDIAIYDTNKLFTVIVTLKCYNWILNLYVFANFFTIGCTITLTFSNTLKFWKKCEHSAITFYTQNLNKRKSGKSIKIFTNSRRTLKKKKINPSNNVRFPMMQASKEHYYLKKTRYQNTNKTAKNEKSKYSHHDVAVSSAEWDYLVYDYYIYIRGFGTSIYTNHQPIKAYKYTFNI